MITVNKIGVILRVMKSVEPQPKGGRVANAAASQEIFVMTSNIVVILCSKEGVSKGQKVENV